MSNIVISAVNNHSKLINLDHRHSFRKRGSYTLIKVKLARRINFNSMQNEEIQIQPMDLAFKSELIYHPSEQKFHKNRHALNGTNDTDNLPEELKPLFGAIIDISADIPYKELEDKYNKYNLLEAIFLTNTALIFQYDIDMVAYQILRYQYGKDINPKYLENIIEDYPEKLI